MALKIFATDPEAKPTPRPDTDARYDYVFQFRSGMQVYNKSKKRNEPVSLANWRVLTGDPDVAAGIGELMGGLPDEFAPEKELNFQVLTDQPKVEIVISGSDAIEDKLILWGPRGPIHECDGVSLLSPPEDAGTACGCPELMSDRKAKAKAGTGPAPSINVTFRLAGLGYELGQGKLISTAWTLATVIHEVKDALDAVKGDALCTLELELVQFTNKAGIDVEYRKPVIKVLGSYNDAIAEDGHA